jgi:hypothetical protein
MLTQEIRNAWQEALRRALLVCQPASELSDPALAAASGLLVSSGLQAGYLTGDFCYPAVGGGYAASAGCTMGTNPWPRYGFLSGNVVCP